MLKGVDGVVFVADSQRLMLDANVESLANLETNLAEIGFKINDLPVVIQYNKRDLPGRLSPVRAGRLLNKHGLPSFEACALSGQGVFETLTGIAKLTLASLRDRLTAGKTAPRPQTPGIAPRPRATGPAAGSATPHVAGSEPRRWRNDAIGGPVDRPSTAIGADRAGPIGSPRRSGRPATRSPRWPLRSRKPPAAPTATSR